MSGASDLAREKQLFLGAVELHGAERSAWLDEHCAGAELRQRIERLLAAHDAASDDDDALGVETTRPFALRTTLSGTEFGDYLLVDEVASGGMGVVYRATQKGLDRTVAVKVMRGGRFASDTEIRRFRTEAEAVARLDHPHIVPIYEVGEADGHHFFSMKLIAGADLSNHIERLRARPRSAAKLLADVAWAVHHGHQRGVLHRDLKPSNILVDDATGHPYVTDFGIAKMVGSGAGTRSGAVLGTPGYMAPEQATGHAEVTTASDVYALGGILYTLLTGQAPFPGDSPVDVLVRKAREDAPPPRRVDPTVDRDLDTICQTCLAREPGRRYRSARALAEELERWLAHRPIQARPVPPLERAVLWVRRRPLVSALLAAVTVLAVSLVAGAISSGAALRRNLDRAVAAEQMANQRLRASFISQARAVRRLAEPGRRFTSLDLLKRAAHLGDGTDLRDGIIASLALTDLRVTHEWPIEGAGPVGLDPSFQHYFVAKRDGVVFRRVDDDELVVELATDAQPWEVVFGDSGRTIVVKTGVGQYTPGAARASVWEFPSGRPLSAFPIADSRLRLASDGQSLLGITEQGAVRIRRLDGTEVRIVAGDPEVRSFAISPDGQSLALAHTGGFIDIVAIADGRRRRRLPGHERVYDIDWSPDGRRLVFGASDFRAYVIDVEPIDDVHRTLVLDGHIAEVVAVAFSTDATLVYTHSWDGTLRLWDAQSAVELLSVEARLLSTAASGNRVGFSRIQEFGILDVAHQDFVRTLHAHTGKSPHTVALSPDQRLLATGGTDGLVLWEFPSGKELGHLFDGQVWSTYFHPDGKQLFTSGHSGLRRWRLDPDHPLEQPTNELLFDARAEEMTLSADGTTAIIAVGEVLQVIDLATLDARPIRSHADTPSGLSMSPDSSMVAVGSWRGGLGVLVWDVASGAELRRMLPDEEKGGALFAPDGRHLVTSGRDLYRVWRVDDWQQVCDIPRTGRFINERGRASFGPDGMLAVALSRSDVGLVELDTCQVVGKLLHPEPTQVTALLFTRDGDRLVVGTAARRIQIWEIGELRRELRARGAGDIVTNKAQ